MERRGRENKKNKKMVDIKRDMKHGVDFEMNEYMVNMNKGEFIIRDGTYIYS